MRLSDTLPDFTGSLLDDERLELLECLGSGAYGKVYKAVDRTSSPGSPTYFAVKCLLKPEAGSKEEEYQLREITLHKKVSGHSNIVTIHEVLFDDFFVYVILDFYDGGDLFAAITEIQTFDYEDETVKRVFVQLLDAVQHCHDLGVYHRDLKPENVLCSKDGSFVAIADFGLCTDKRICEDFGCGSSYYMSPECLGKDTYRSHYSPRQNDVWSLGVILINLITARNPWNLAVSKDEHYACFLKDPNYLRQLLPVSDAVHRILLRIFELNPLRRISIPSLRREILAIKTFHADRLSKRSPAASKPEVVTVYTDEFLSSSDESVSECSTCSFGSNQISLQPAGPTPLAELLDGQLHISSHPKPSNKHVAVAKTYSRWCGNSSCSDSDSGSDVGPETPASRAVEPKVDVEIPEMRLDGGLEEEADMPTPKIGQQPFIARAKAVATGPPRYLARGFAKLIR
ncbi:hypothetical protein V5O48_006411 [Marasmius crinis-equi]|uniref:non-specific serine/threonine protein kinase n=1 Tax=Marasmius crinis-equi TaxID=585013 RepID=A0ABR3FK44_9AGAR